MKCTASSPSNLVIQASINAPVKIMVAYACLTANVATSVRA
jgi:hypothetical protein